MALLVLLLTLGSLRAAGMPLLTALLGVAISVVMIYAATGLTVVSSTTPMLAVMLGLAVGIDYALFIISRHRDQLRDGMEPEESAARALATAGSAVSREVATATSSSTGTFSIRFKVPKSALPGKHPVTATGMTSGLSATSNFLVRSNWAEFHFDPANSGLNPGEPGSSSEPA